MAEAVRKLSCNAQIRETLGAAARQYALNHLHVDAVLAAAEREFEAVVQGRAKPLDSRTREGDI
jgi:colanic acid biosynthesis glycosyl transferase WcaI